MNFEPDISDDCLLVDGTESVTLHSSGVIAIEGAKRGPLRLSEIEFRQVGLQASDMGWLLPGGALGSVEPRQGDTIEESSGTFWTILSAEHSPLADLWRVVSRRQL